MYGVHSGPQMTFDTAVVDMVACTGIPFNVLDHPTTVKLFNISNPRLYLKHRTTYSRQVTPRAESVMSRVNRIIAEDVTRGLYSAAFSTDDWTSRAQVPYMSLSMHYINHDWRMQCWCLKVSPHHGRHTAVNLRYKLSEMIDDVGLPDSVHKFAAMTTARP